MHKFIHMHYTLYTTIIVVFQIFVATDISQLAVKLISPSHLLGPLGTCRYDRATTLCTFIYQHGSYSHLLQYSTGVPRGYLV